MGPLSALDRGYPNVFATCFGLSRTVIKHQLVENIETPSPKVTMSRKVKVKGLLASLLLLPSLSSATPSSASHHHLLFTLFCLETIGGHHPHNWCLVEFWLAIQNVISSVGRDPDCLVDLSFKAALKTSNNRHGEGLLLAIVDKLAMFPQRWVFSLVPEAILVFQPSREIQFKRLFNIIFSGIFNSKNYSIIFFPRKFNSKIYSKFLIWLDSIQ